MPRAVLQKGVIVPIDPLPPDWEDGRELLVQDFDEPPPESADLDRWYAELEDAVAKIDPRDAGIIDAAIAEADHIAKDQVRREMGLP